MNNIQELISECDGVGASVQLEFYSLQVKYAQLTGQDFSDIIHEIELKIPKLEA